MSAGHVLSQDQREMVLCCVLSEILQVRAMIEVAVAEGTPSASGYESRAAELRVRLSEHEELYARLCRSDMTLVEVAGG